MKTPMPKKKAINSKKGIMLDIGCGEGKEPGCVGMDIRDLPQVDIVHDMEVLPYPLADESCLSILARHVVEHINPAKFGFVNVMNEWWRILKPYGRLMITTPYAGSSGYWADPSHINPCTEQTWFYFAPEHPSGMWQGYKPKPWRIIANAWHSNGNLEVVLAKLPIIEPQTEKVKNGNKKRKKTARR
jgi:SAM-dependent methyltransferase